MKRTEHTQKWIDALRSGEHKQTWGMLEYEGNFCAIGVGAFVSGIDMDYRDGLYTEIEQSLGMSANERLLIVKMNDDIEKTFPEIADEIEKMLDATI